MFINYTQNPKISKMIFVLRFDISAAVIGHRAYILKNCRIPPACLRFISDLTEVMDKEQELRYE